MKLNQFFDIIFFSQSFSFSKLELILSVHVQSTVLISPPPPYNRVFPFLVLKLGEYMGPLFFAALAR